MKKFIKVYDVELEENVLINPLVIESVAERLLDTGDESVKVGRIRTIDGGIFITKEKLNVLEEMIEEALGE